MSTAKFDLEKFTGKNDFGLWRIKMKAVMMQQGLWEVLKGGKIDADQKTDVKAQDLQDKAYSTLILSLSDRVLREVSKEETATAVWNKLESLYMTKSLTNRLLLKQRLFAFKFTESRGIGEQLEEFAKCIDDLENIDEPIKDEDKALMLLNSLPKSFEQFKDAILLGRDSKVTYEEVHSALKMKEFQKAASKPIDSASESLNVKEDFKKSVKKKSQKKNKPWEKKGGDDKETMSCYHCKKPGHIKKNCFAFKKKQQEQQAAPNTADVIEEVQTAEVLNIADEDIRNVWIMDSGCSFHMSSHLEWFEDLQESEGIVLLGNDQECKIVGIGNIRLKMADGSTRILSDVRFIPNIKRNLISLGVLEKKGCSFASSNGQMKVMKDSKVVITAIRKRNLYYLQAQVVSGEINAISKDDLNLWHLRLGHVSEAGLKTLAKKGVINAETSTTLKHCEECVMGKSKKQPYGTGKHISERPLDYTQ